MLNNYKQALSILSEYLPILEEFQRAHGYMDRDFETWRKEEAAFLADAAQEPEAETMAVAYVEALQKLQRCQ